MDVPYCIVKGKARLGKVSNLKTTTCLAITEVKAGDKPSLAKVIEAVRAHGGSVTLEPFELRPGRKVSQVADPDGNMIELGQG